MNKIVAAYSDGGLVSPNPSKEGGSWAYVLVNSEGEIDRYCSGLVPGEATSNLVEFVAMLEMFKELPQGWTGVAYTDSQVTWERFRRPEAASYRGISDEMIQEMHSTMRRVGDRHQVMLIQGHPTKAELVRGVGKSGLPVSRFNVFADRLCTEMVARLRLERSAPEEHSQFPAGKFVDKTIKYQF